VTARVDRFLDPSSGDTYQIDTAMDSFLSGGWFGRGPGEGTVKRILPDSHTDFIFAVVAEEFGIIVCLLLVAVFAFIVIRGLSRSIEGPGCLRPPGNRRACGPFRAAGDDQSGGEPEPHATKGHDAAVHFLWRLVAAFVGNDRRRIAGADPAQATAHPRRRCHRQPPFAFQPHVRTERFFS
jgi:hypothetical protein